MNARWRVAPHHRNEAGVCVSGTGYFDMAMQCLLRFQLLFHTNQCQIIAEYH